MQSKLNKILCMLLWYRICTFLKHTKVILFISILDMCDQCPQPELRFFHWKRFQRYTSQIYKIYVLKAVTGNLKTWWRLGWGPSPSLFLPWDKDLSNITGGFLLDFFSSMYCICIQHCFICHTSDSTVSEDAEIEPRTVATSALAVRPIEYNTFSKTYLGVQ